LADGAGAAQARCGAFAHAWMTVAMAVLVPQLKEVLRIKASIDLCVYRACVAFVGAAPQLSLFAIDHSGMAETGPGGRLAGTTRCSKR
jgi:hypothetical protein